RFIPTAKAGGFRADFSVKFTSSAANGWPFVENHQKCALYATLRLGAPGAECYNSAPDSLLLDLPRITEYV
ncbi:MAG: hypothetical protein ACUVSU_05970, partial [Aggregatilineaceae bacterium]